ncbi:MAG: hypothetical protein R6V16_00275, partial [Bacteroidales bacterium]
GPFPYAGGKSRALTGAPSPRSSRSGTSGWEKEFLKYLNGNTKPKEEKTVQWGKYSSTLMTINGINFIEVLN